MMSIFGTRQAKAKLSIELDGVLHHTTMMLDSFEIDAVFAPDDPPIHVAVNIDRYRIVLTGKIVLNMGSPFEVRT